MIRVLAFDIDGTICLDNNKIPCLLKRAIMRCRQNGLFILLATGRSIVDLQIFQENSAWSSPAVILNGAAILEGVQLKKCEYLDPSSIIQVTGCFKKWGVPYVCYLDHQTAAFQGRESDYATVMRMHLGKETDMDALFRSFTSLSMIEIVKKQVLKIEACLDDMSIMYELRRDLETIQNIHVTSSMAFNLEVTSSNANKGKKLKQYLNSLGFDDHEVMVFGDSENDISMFERFEHSVLVRNDRSVFDYSTRYKVTSPDGIGLAHFINSHFDL